MFVIVYLVSAGEADSIREVSKTVSCHFSFGSPSRSTHESGKAPKSAVDCIPPQR